MLLTTSQRAITGSMAVLAALACVWATLALPAPADWLYWLALPLLCLARIQLQPRQAARWTGAHGRGRGLMALMLILAAGLLCELLLGSLTRFVHRPVPLYSLLGLSALLVGLILVQWRTWPWFGLLFVAELPSEGSGDSLWRRLRDRGSHLSEPADAYFSHGLAVSCAGLAVVAAPLAIDGWNSELPRWPLALLLMAVLLISVEVILRRTEHALQRPRPRTDLPSFLLDGRGPEESTDPDDLPLPAAVPVGPDQDLLVAARLGDADGVSLALAAGANVNSRPGAESADQRSPLIAAATAVDRGALRALIAAGAQVDAMCGGISALHAATRDSYAGRIDAVMTLLSNGADPNKADEAGNTPLHFAALTRDAGIAQSLLDAGARVDVLNREEMTPLALACEAGNWLVVEFLIKNGARADLELGTPALLFAAAVDGDEPRGVKLLLKAKAKVDAAASNGRTALMVAALADNAEIAEALLAAGAEIDTRDQAGHCALLEAARAGANRVLRRLVFHKPDAKVCGPRGRQALHLAALAGNANVETIDLLLALGCKAEALDDDGVAAADLAAAAGRWPLVRHLDPDYPIPSAHELDDSEAELQAQAHIEADLPGPLLVRAAMQGRFPLYQELLQVPGIDISDLREALVAASPHQDRRFVEAVLDQGFDAFARDSSGWSLWEGLCAAHPVPWYALNALVDRAERSSTAAAVLLPGLCKIARAPADDASANALFARAIELADCNGRDSQGMPALLLAVEALPIELLQQMLDAGAEAGACGGHGETVLTQLVWAKRKDARELAPMLIRAGADPARRTSDGSTAAGLARATGQSALASLLDWPAGAHPGTALDGCTVATTGRRGDLNALDRLLELGLDVDGRDAQGASALLHAAGTGQLELCQALLDRGADLNCASAQGVTPLAAAILAGRSAVVEWLLARGVRRESVLLGRMTPLALAAACLRLPMVEYLLQRGADPEGRAGTQSPVRATLDLLTDSSRPLPLLKAVLTRLIEGGANPDSPDDQGRTPLLSLLGSGKPEPEVRDEARLQPIVQALLQGGANANAIDREGRCALHWVCRHGLIQCGGTLLELGADPRISDQARQLPIDLLTPRHRIHLGPALRQAAEAWNRQRGPRQGG